MDRISWENRREFDRGSLTGKEYFTNILARAGVFPGESNIEKIAETDFQSWIRINSETVKLMEDVKGTALKLGILSNMGQVFLDRVRKTIPVFSLPDVGIFSCEVGSVKPEEPIYRALFSALGCEPGAIIFFDDTSVNVDKALDLGMRAFVWKDPSAARAELQRLGVPV
jgi:putative hydrolase of the HAD superfamily